MAERFNDLPPAPIDQIMIANAQWPSFAQEHPGAINTTIGVMVDPIGDYPWQPSSVKRARQETLRRLMTDGKFGYQTQVGHERFLQAAGNRVLGSEAESEITSGDILAYQTLGGTGSLSLARDVLAALVRTDADGQIPLVLDSGWPNHPAIFSEPFALSGYQHMSPETGAYNHPAALEAFGEAPEGAIFLLQTCGYNDDGMDRTREQWNDILAIAEEKSATVLLDSAYMGLVTGFDQERYPIDQSIERGLLTLVSFSASKNMGLYNERLGALYIANAKPVLGAEQAARLHQAVGKAVRRTVSNAPLAVAQAAANALQDFQYLNELGQARKRLADNRQTFAEVLAEQRPAIKDGGGLFTKILASGFSPEQQHVLNEAGVFVLPNSRINLGGIHSNRVERVAEAVAAALHVQ